MKKEIELHVSLCVSSATGISYNGKKGDIKIDNEFDKAKIYGCNGHEAGNWISLPKITVTVECDDSVIADAELLVRNSLDEKMNRLRDSYAKESAAIQAEIDAIKG